MHFLLPIAATLASLCVAGLVVRAGLSRLRVPAAVSLMALGVVVGPQVLDWLPESWLEQRNVLSRAAFVLLLLRAGLALPHAGLRRVALAALAFGTIPVLAEFMVIAVAAQILHLFDQFSVAMLAAFLVAAVSPAVILPIMLQQKDRGRGAERLIPDRIIGQTVVNAFIAQTGILIMLQVTAADARPGAVVNALMWLPIQVVGAAVLGTLLVWPTRFVGFFHSQASAAAESGRSTRTWFVALASFLIAGIAYFGCERLSLESVVATLTVGFILRSRFRGFDSDIRHRLRQVWSIGEIVLFTNLGSQIEIQRMRSYEDLALLAAILVAALLVRLVAAAWMLRRTSLTPVERRYATASHVPKATIQAVFGAVPLAVFTQRGQVDLIADGHMILILAVIAIVGTAPLGAFLLERWGDRLGTVSSGTRD